MVINETLDFRETLLMGALTGMVTFGVCLVHRGFIEYHENLSIVFLENLSIVFCVLFQNYQNICNKMRYRKDAINYGLAKFGYNEVRDHQKFKRIVWKRSFPAMLMVWELPHWFHSQLLLS